MNDLSDRVGYTITFLRMTATEMRNLVEDTPEIARELGYIAEQVEVEAKSLAGYIADYGGDQATASRRGFGRRC